MPMQAIYNGSDTLSDGADWSFSVVIQDAAGALMDLEGSAFRCTFRSIIDASPVFDASTEPNGGMVIASPATLGRVDVTIPVRLRTWAAPQDGTLGLARVVTVVGDLLRRADPADPLKIEDEARILLKVRPSTTRWPQSSP